MTFHLFSPVSQACDVCPQAGRREAVRASLLPSEEGVVPVRTSTDHTDAGVRREKTYLNTDLWRTFVLRRLGRN